MPTATRSARASRRSNKLSPSSRLKGSPRGQMRALAATTTRYAMHCRVVRSARFFPPPSPDRRPLGGPLGHPATTTMAEATRHSSHFEGPFCPGAQRARSFLWEREEKSFRALVAEPQGSLKCPLHPLSCKPVSAGKKAQRVHFLLLPPALGPGPGLSFHQKPKHGGTVA
jgi:hypothetical protein